MISIIQAICANKRRVFIRLLESARLAAQELPPNSSAWAANTLLHDDLCFLLVLAHHLLKNFISRRCYANGSCQSCSWVRLCSRVEWIVGYAGLFSQFNNCYDIKTPWMQSVPVRDQTKSAFGSFWSLEPTAMTAAKMKSGISSTKIF